MNYKWRYKGWVGQKSRIKMKTRFYTMCLTALYSMANMDSRKFHLSLAQETCTHKTSSTHFKFQAHTQTQSILKTCTSRSLIHMCWPMQSKNFFSILFLPRQHTLAIAAQPHKSFVTCTVVIQRESASAWWGKCGSLDKLNGCSGEEWLFGIFIRIQ